MKDKKHLYWVVGLVLITIVLCGTLIWINHNSWTLRFEMDDNTLKAVESIEYPITYPSQKERCVDVDYGYNNGKGFTSEDVNKTKLKETINCLEAQL